jgi:hypothetical protein
MSIDSLVQGSLTLPLSIILKMFMLNLDNIGLQLLGKCALLPIATRKFPKLEFLIFL